MPEDTTLRLRTSDLVWNHVDDEIVVLDTKTSTYLHLNGSASGLWPDLVAGTTAERLSAALVSAYGIDPGAATSDVTALVNDLRDRELLDQPRAAHSGEASSLA